MKKTFYTLILLSIGMLFSIPTYSQGSERVPLQHVTDGYETDVIKLSRGMNGKITSITTSRCNSCPIERYKVINKTKVYIGRQEVTFDDITQYNGKSGTVAYYVNTNDLDHLRFFDLEDAQ